MLRGTLLWFGQWTSESVDIPDVPVLVTMTDSALYHVATDDEAVFGVAMTDGALYRVTTDDHLGG
jgi:hypothetical protein